MLLADAEAPQKGNPLTLTGISHGFLVLRKKNANHYYTRLH